MSVLEEKRCWICLGEEADDLEASWVAPCLCRGSVKYTHEHCLLQWYGQRLTQRIYEKQGPEWDVVGCPSCGYVYQIQEYALLLTRTDRRI